MKEIVSSDKLPRPVGPYSQAVRGGNLLFTSGQIPIDTGGNVVEGDIAVQTERALKNVESVLGACGLGLADIVKTTVYMTDLGLFGKMNDVYGRFFRDNPPARSTVEVAGLPKNVLVEIEAVASFEERK